MYSCFSRCLCLFFFFITPPVPYLSMVSNFEYFELGHGHGGGMNFHEYRLQDTSSAAAPVDFDTPPKTDRGNIMYKIRVRAPLFPDPKRDVCDRDALEDFLQ